MWDGEAKRETQTTTARGYRAAVVWAGGCRFSSERHVVKQRGRCHARLVRTTLAAVPALDLGSVVVAHAFEQLLQDVEQLRGGTVGDVRQHHGHEGEGASHWTSSTAD